MAYNQNLTERIESVLSTKPGITQKKMFGGLCFLLNGNMLCGIRGDKLMARVGPYNYDYALKQKYATEMDFTGKPLKGMIYVLPKGIKRKESLKKWIDMCIEFVGGRPKKK
ncbi:MAG: TfoX/Sxy family protein [Candidatus Dadabacteria bacterium]|nr:TfoX/Sxy family protein [Candidatus Dadabacteria bacterium]NIS10002.1 TfoX/Sxy family protein [Candidatus Dadabacteria bacterium]NIV43256.1 RNA methyltransferase [Candidatus Dadabacteria bacterium]NIX16383.1 RNA methyltransferase [Candidatus Dadabacteria bacterium]NIY22973.1 RNA methyltransferase [Candidatus Dadabacteria bacterium]